MKFLALSFCREPLLTEQGHQEENDNDVVGVPFLVEVQQQAEEHDLQELWEVAKVQVMEWVPHWRPWEAWPNSGC